MSAGRSLRYRDRMSRRRTLRSFADFCNGTSAALDFRDWTFLNADLTISMAREPIGEWILLDAESWIGSEGAGLAMARLADRGGYFGRCVQSLVIERR